MPANTSDPARKDSCGNRFGRVTSGGDGSSGMREHRSMTASTTRSSSSAAPLVLLPMDASSQELVAWFGSFRQDFSPYAEAALRQGVTAQDIYQASFNELYSALGIASVVHKRTFKNQVVALRKHAIAGPGSGAPSLASLDSFLEYRRNSATSQASHHRASVASGSLRPAPATSSTGGSRPVSIHSRTAFEPLAEEEGPAAERSRATTSSSDGDSNPVRRRPRSQQQQQRACPKAGSHVAARPNKRASFDAAMLLMRAEESCDLLENLPPQQEAEPAPAPGSQPGAAAGDRSRVSAGSCGSSASRGSDDAWDSGISSASNSLVGNSGAGATLRSYARSISGASSPIPVPPFPAVDVVPPAGTAPYRVLKEGYLVRKKGALAKSAKVYWAQIKQSPDGYDAQLELYEGKAFKQAICLAGARVLVNPKKHGYFDVVYGKTTWHLATEHKGDTTQDYKDWIVVLQAATLPPSHFRRTASGDGATSEVLAPVSEDGGDDQWV